MSDGTWFLVLFLVVGVLGLRGSIRLTRRYRAVKTRLDNRDRLILLVIVWVAWLVTFSALYFGGLSIRRVLGFETIPQLNPVSALIAIAIFLIPVLLDAVVDRVARVPWS